MGLWVGGFRVFQTIQEMKVSLFFQSLNLRTVLKHWTMSYLIGTPAHVQSQTSDSLPPAKLFPPHLSLPILLNKISSFQLLKPNCLELSLNILFCCFSYPTFNSSANTVSSVFKIYPESDHFHHFYYHHLDLKHHHLLAGLLHNLHSICQTIPKY